jgi:CBS domain-containing protein
VIDGCAHVATTRTVRCERRDQSVALSECRTCDQCAGLTLDESTLICNWGRPMARAQDGLARLARKLFPQIARETRVGDVMSPRVLCVRPDVSLEMVSDLLLAEGFSGAPVVDEHGFPIGVISKTDLVREHRTRGDTHELESPLEPGFHEEKLATATVAEAMMPIAFTIEEQSSLADAASVMSTEGVHRVPVVAEDGRVVGLLSSLDIVRWLAES